MGIRVVLEELDTATAVAITQACLAALTATDRAIQSEAAARLALPVYYLEASLAGLDERLGEVRSASQVGAGRCHARVSWRKTRPAR